MANLRDCDIKFQSYYNIQLRINTLKKGMNLFIHPAMS